MDMQERLVTMLNRIHVMIERGDRFSPHDELYDEIGCLIAEARGDYVDQGDDGPFVMAPDCG